MAFDPRPSPEVLEAQAKTRGYGCEATAGWVPSPPVPTHPGPSWVRPGGACWVQRQVHAVPMAWELGEGLRDSPWLGVHGGMAQWHSDGLPKTTRLPGTWSQSRSGSTLGERPETRRGSRAYRRDLETRPSTRGKCQRNRGGRPTHGPWERRRTLAVGIQYGLPRTGPHRPPFDLSSSRERAWGCSGMK